MVMGNGGSARMGWRHALPQVQEIHSDWFSSSGAVCYKASNGSGPPRRKPFGGRKGGIRHGRGRLLKRHSRSLALR